MLFRKSPRGVPFDELAIEIGLEDAGGDAVDADAEWAHSLARPRMMPRTPDLLEA